MPYVTLLGSLVLYEPQTARQRILDGIRDAGGNLTHAAEKLGVQHRTLCRWCAELGLARDIELIRIAAGWADPRSHIGEMRNSDRPSKFAENPRPISPHATEPIKKQRFSRAVSGSQVTPAAEKPAAEKPAAKQKRTDSPGSYSMRCAKKV